MAGHLELHFNHWVLVALKLGGNGVQDVLLPLDTGLALLNSFDDLVLLCKLVCAIPEHLGIGLDLEGRQCEHLKACQVKPCGP